MITKTTTFFARFGDCVRVFAWYGAQRAAVPYPPCTCPYWRARREEALAFTLPGGQVALTLAPPVAWSPQNRCRHHAAQQPRAGHLQGLLCQHRCTQSDLPDRLIPGLAGTKCRRGGAAAALPLAPASHQPLRAQAMTHLLS